MSGSNERSGAGRMRDEVERKTCCVLRAGHQAHAHRTCRFPRANREATTSLKTSDTATTETPSTACWGSRKPVKMEVSPRKPAKPSCVTALFRVPVTGPLNARERTHDNAHVISSGVGGRRGEAEASASGDACSCIAVAALATDRW
eukprot:scaffold77164_cov30-Tisochrysis_lutea.AAC.3